MSDFGVIICGECNGLLVDSGYTTLSTLKCSECNNEKEFKVGKVTISSDAGLSSVEIVTQAKRDAGIL
jgi:DNA-directed RNA polymerase subunit M/transcription elongation factor TFIIS